jgi:hypothetical protein
MPEATGPLWDTAIDRSPPLLAAGAVGLGAAGAAVHCSGGTAAPVLFTAAVALAVMLARHLTRVACRPVWIAVYHSDDDGLVVAPRRGRASHLTWEAIIEMRESAWGELVIVTPETWVRLPRRVARRDAFGMAAFERVVPRLAGELWDGLANGHMVAICPDRRGAVLALVLGLAVGAGLVLPAGVAWGSAILAGGLVLFAATRTRTRGVWLSATGIGDRDRFIGWDGAELSENRWSLIVRDPVSGWVTRIPRSVANYHAIAVVACAAQALGGSEVTSVAFRSATDSRGIRIVVEGSVPGEDPYH